MFNRKDGLLERDVRHAAQYSNNNAEAAAFLSVNVKTWSKYAKLFFDSETGLSYYDLLRYSKRSKIKKTKSQSIEKRVGFYRIPIDRVLSGNHPSYDKDVLVRRLINEGYKYECCDMCGYVGKNVVTNETPLILNFIDGNPKNFLLSNLEFLCYNCAATTTNITIKISYK